MQGKNFSRNPALILGSILQKKLKGKGRKKLQHAFGCLSEKLLSELAGSLHTEMKHESYIF